MTDVQVARGVGQHGEGVVRLPGGIDIRMVEAVRLPPLLPFLLDGRRVISVCHDVPPQVFNLSGAPLIPSSASQRGAGKGEIELSPGETRHVHCPHIIRTLCPIVQTPEAENALISVAGPA